MWCQSGVDSALLLFLAIQAVQLQQEKCFSVNVYTTLVWSVIFPLQ